VRFSSDSEVQGLQSNSKENRRIAILVALLAALRAAISL